MYCLSEQDLCLPVIVIYGEFFGKEWIRWRLYHVDAVQVRGVKPMPIPELANLFTNLQLAVTSGLVICNSSSTHLFFSHIFMKVIIFYFPSQDTNPNNLVASTTFFSDSTKAMLCLVSKIDNSKFMKANIQNQV